MARMRVLNKQQVAQALTMEGALQTVEAMYRAKAQGQTETWPTIFSIFKEGVADVDIKSGWLKADKVFGHKTASLFVENPVKGLDSLQAVINTYSSETGEVTGIVSAGQITGMRTGAAGATGAKWLTREDARTALICGTGNQGLYQAAGLLTALPQIETIAFWDRNATKARAFVGSLVTNLEEGFGIKAAGLAFSVADNLEPAVRAADVIITCTPATTPYIKAGWVRPGTHISAVGADAAGKQELESAIAGKARIFVDDLPHCVEAGEVERPIKEGVIGPDDIAGELGAVMEGGVAGRASDDEITLFDTAGLAILDIASAEAALAAAEQAGIGAVVDGM